MKMTFGIAVLLATLIPCRGPGIVTTNELCLVQEVADASLSNANGFSAPFRRISNTLNWTPEHVSELLEALFRTNVAAVGLPPEANYRYPETNAPVTRALRRCDCAILLLADFGATNSIPFLTEVLCTTNYTRWYWDAAFAYVARTAFPQSECRWMLSFISPGGGLWRDDSPFLNSMQQRAFSQAFSSAQSNAVRNILLTLEGSTSGDTMFLDKVCLDIIPDYVSSSNRFIFANRIMAESTVTAITNYFAPIQAQLNAATNLVELSTNDFLNAGE